MTLMTIIIGTASSMPQIPRIATCGAEMDLSLYSRTDGPAKSLGRLCRDRWAL
jgi:hypothetical protein